jgi:hypothetical protein
MVVKFIDFGFVQYPYIGKTGYQKVACCVSTYVDLRKHDG